MLVFQKAHISSFVSRRFSIRIYRCFSTRKSYDRYEPPPTVFGSQEFWLKRRYERYCSLYRWLQPPPPVSFLADGVEYPLPYHCPGTPLIDQSDGISDCQVRLLCGHFSARGNSWMGGRRKVSTGLRMIERVTQAEVPKMFLEAFGGSIHTFRQPLAGGEALVSWNISGARARKAAKLLTSIPTHLHSELDFIINTIPAEHPVSKRQQLYAQFREMRLRRPVHDFSTLESAAAFLDHNGSIQIYRCPSTKYCIDFSHDSSAVLEAFDDFITKHGLPRSKSSLKSYSGNGIPMYRLTIYGFSNVQALLRLLQPFIIKKRRLVDIIVNHAPSSSADQEFCDSLAEFRTRRGDDRRASPELRQLAIDIKKFYNRMAKKRFKGKHEHIPDLKSQLQPLYEQRHILSLKNRVANRRDGILSLLSRGAVVISGSRSGSKRQYEKFKNAPV